MKKIKNTTETRGRKMNLEKMRLAKQLYKSKKLDGSLMSYRDVAEMLGIDVRNTYDYINLKTVVDK